MGKKNDCESIENTDYLPNLGHPMQETVYYQMGGTVYEVTTNCQGSEKLTNKIIRLLKSESINPPADKQL